MGADDGRHHAGFRLARKQDVLNSVRELATVDPEQFRRDLDAVIDPTYKDPFER
jgi:hypothetical protein